LPKRQNIALVLKTRAPQGACRLESCTLSARKL